LAHWTPDFDIATIPDEVLLRESVRRIRARQVRAPRLKVLRQRPKCRDAFGARELREHLPHCALRAAAKAIPDPTRRVRKVTSREVPEAENYCYWQSIPVGDRLAAVCEVTEAAYAIRKIDRDAHQGHEGVDPRIQ
jgi:hypothetical protein